MDIDNIAPKQRIRAALILDDLEVQAMVFDMDIDIETLTLQPKNNYKESIWITRWKEKRHDADYDEQLDIDRE